MTMTAQRSSSGAWKPCRGVLAMPGESVTLTGRKRVHGPTLVRYRVRICPLLPCGWRGMIIVQGVAHAVGPIAPGTAAWIDAPVTLAIESFDYTVQVTPDPDSRNCCWVQIWSGCRRGR